MKKKLIFLTTLFAVFSATGISSFAASPTEDSDTLSIIFALLRQCPPVIIVSVLGVVFVVLAVVFRKKAADLLDNTSASAMTNTFILFFSVFGLACFGMAIATYGATWKHLLTGTDNSYFAYTHFADFMKTLQHTGAKNFELSAEKFSPLSLSIFYVLAQFVPTDLLFADSNKKYIEMLKSPLFVYLYLILVLFCIVLIYRMSRSKLRKNGIKLRNEVIAFLLVVSYPTMYCISMGNIAGFSVALCLFFLEFYTSEEKLYRELSIIAIAVSAAIVPYTFVFALLLLLDDSKMAKLNFLQSVAFFAVLFVVPSIFTGFGNMLTYLKSIVAIPELYLPSNGSIANILNLTGAGDTVLYVFTVITEVVALACIFILPNAWQKSAAAVYFILNLMPSANSLPTIFVFIPLVYLLSEKKHKATDWLYLLAFMLLVTPFPEWYRSCADNFKFALDLIGVHGLNNANELITPVAVQMLFVLIVSQSVAILKNKKKTPAVEAVSEEAAT